MKRGTEVRKVAWHPPPAWGPGLASHRHPEWSLPKTEPSVRASQDSQGKASQGEASWFPQHMPVPILWGGAGRGGFMILLSVEPAKVL